MKHSLRSLGPLLTIAAAIAANADQPPFGRMDVFELEWASNPQISPNGDRIVYSRNGMDVMTDSRMSQLWLVDVDGENHVPLIGDLRSGSSPAWSPDNTRIAFVSAAEHGAEVFVAWLDDGTFAKLTELPRAPSGLSWSPDGSQIAFSMLVPEEPVVLVEPPAQPDGAEWAEAPRITVRKVYERDGSGYIEPGFNHFFVMPAAGGSPRQVTDGNYHHRGMPHWTPDGKSLVFSANRNDDWETNYANSEVYRLDLESGDITALTDRNGPDFRPVVSSESGSIAWLTFEDKVQTYQVLELWVMNPDGTEKRKLETVPDRSIEAAAWDRNGRTVYYQYSDFGDTHIASVRLRGGGEQQVSSVGGVSVGRPYSGGSFSIANNGTLAYTFGTPYRPADVAVSRGNDSRQLTSLNEDILAFRELGKIEEIRYPATTDVRDIQGWVVYPPGYVEGGNYPLLVENHGGPVSHYGPWFSPEIQLYAAAGYVVFYPNPRGSTSYGEEFGNLLYNNYPGDDYQDVMDGVDHLIERGIASEDRLYVTGGSAGGIMTTWIVGKNNRFEAAVVVKPVINWVSKTLVADNYYAYADYRYPGQPWESFEGYMKFSPLSLVGNIETPTMVMVGTADLRTPLSESKQLYNALKIRGIDTALVEVPDAWHFIANKPSQLITKVDHVLAWLAKYPSDNTDSR